MENRLTRVLRRAALFTLALPTLASAGYSNLFILGDSLSDTGNVDRIVDAQIAANGGHALPGFGTSEGVPSPYAGGRFSNGPVWIEHVASGLGLSALPSIVGGTNFAFGSARTDYHPAGAPFQGLTGQAATLISRQGGTLDANALYVVWGGSNNVQDMLRGGSSTPLSTAQDIGHVIDELATAGARNFLVTNVPDLGLVPRVTQNGAMASFYGTMLSKGINSGLEAVIAAERATGLNILSFDAFSFLHEVTQDPTRFGLTNVTDRCYTGDDLSFTGGGSVCANPDQYLFWDGIHPTAAGHALLGQAVLSMLAVPEPGTLALGIVALAGIGVRRRPQRLVSA